MARPRFEDAIERQFERPWDEVVMDKIRTERPSPESLAAYLGCGKRTLMENLERLPVRLNRCLECIEK